jgi:hypothetical protein
VCAERHAASDFSQPGNQTILANIGSTVGLSTTSGAGSADVILSALTYVDTTACAAAGAVDSSGNPSGCTNYGSWVFTQRLVIGNSSVRTSKAGNRQDHRDRFRNVAVRGALITSCP